jgi:hypothetical protein
MLHRAPPHRRRTLRPLEVDLDRLTSAERRDLANALLRAAWSATLEETRILLLELCQDTDDAILGEAA